MRKLRCLELPALQALHAAPAMQAQLSVLLPAAHLVADLRTKLKAVLGKARRPAFAGATAAVAPLPPSEFFRHVHCVCSV
jgi:hypothetical protein